MIRLDTYNLIRVDSSGFPEKIRAMLGFTEIVDNLSVCT